MIEDIGFVLFLSMVKRESQYIRISDYIENIVTLFIQPENLVCCNAIEKSFEWVLYP